MMFGEPIVARMQLSTRKGAYPKVEQLFDMYIIHMHPVVSNYACTL